jgi:hypothetical protein
VPDKEELSLVRLAGISNEKDRLSGVISTGALPL